MNNMGQQLPMDQIDPKNQDGEQITLPIAGENWLFLQPR